jgi:hypothetical protein
MVDHLSNWAQFKRSAFSFEEIAEYWSEIKTIPFNHKIDPYNYSSWPTPWDIVSDHVYDELTLAIVIGYTIKLIDKFKNCHVEIRTMVDSSRTRLYNLVYVDNNVVLNYERGCVVNAQDIPNSFFLENLVELERPR